MKYIQGSVGQILLLLLAMGGIGISIYLTIIHYEHILPICSNTGLINCAHVLSSEYSVVPGTSIPITVPGLGWCLVSAGLAALGLRLAIQPYWLRLAQLLLSALERVVIWVSRRGPCGQSISNRRPSRFVIPSLLERRWLSARAKDLCRARDPSLALRMTLLRRLHLTRNTSSLKWIGPCGRFQGKGFWNAIVRRVDTV